LRYIDKKEVKSIVVKKTRKDGLGYPAVADNGKVVKGLMTAKTFNPFPADSELDADPVPSFEKVGPKPSTPAGQDHLRDFLDDSAGKLLFEMKLVKVA